MAKEATNRFSTINSIQDKTILSIMNDKYKKIYSNLDGDIEILSSIGYKEFIKYYSDMSISKIYNERLIKQGYNAIMDDNDILYNELDSIKPKMPLIVFDPKNNLKVIGSKEISEEDYKKANENLDRLRKQEKNMKKKNSNNSDSLKHEDILEILEHEDILDLTEKLNNNYIMHYGIPRDLMENGEKPRRSEK